MRVEVHCHPFGPPSYKHLGDKIRTVSDLVSFRRKYPELYNARQTEPIVDYVDDLIADMEKHEINKALIMTTPSADSPDVKNDKIATALSKYPGRLFGLMSLGDYSVTGDFDDPEALRQAAPQQIAHWIGERGFKGLGETHGGPFTTEIHPVKIAEDLRPIMEVLATYKAPIMFATGWTQFPGQMYFADPIYVDEIAGRFPSVPIILTKMGRGIEHYFESALIVAMRNPNVYFDTTFTTADHILRAVKTIGADRIMFGSDWAPTWRWVREPEDLYTARLRPVRESGISDGEAEQILGTTAEQLFDL